MLFRSGDEVHGNRLTWCVREFKGGEETVPSVALGLIPLAVRTGLDIGRDVGIHPGPPEVPPHKLDCFLLSEVSGHFAIVFRFENCWDHLLGNVEAFTVVEYVV